MGEKTPPIKINKMYKRNKIPKTTLKVNSSTEGETIEQKIRRVTQNKEPIQDGAPTIFTDRKDGVRPEYDIRTDRFELAVEAMSGIHKDHMAKRQERHFPKKVEGDGEAKSISGTDQGEKAA